MPPKKYSWHWNDTGVEIIVDNAYDEIKYK